MPFLDEIWTTIATPTFIFCSVILAVLLNVFSNYLTRWLDRGGEKVSAWWRSQSQRRQNRFEQHVKRLSVSPEELACAQFEHVRALRTAFFLFSAATFFMLLSILDFLVGSTGIVISLFAPDATKHAISPFTSMRVLMWSSLVLVVVGNGFYSVASDQARVLRAALLRKRNTARQLEHDAATAQRMKEMNGPA